MDKIIDYKIVWECDRENEVMDLINDGWIPLGGVAVRHGSSSGHSLVQAMVKYESKDIED